MVTFILVFLLSGLIAGVLLVIMVKKYYWGPTGLPPTKRRQLNKEMQARQKNAEANDSRQT